LIGDYFELCNGFDVASVKDHRSLRIAVSLLGRLQRNPHSHYRAKVLHQLALEPNKETSDKLDELEYLGWSADTYAAKEQTDAILSLRHVILMFASSFGGGKKSNSIDPPDPSYRPGQHHKDDSATPATKQGTINMAAKKPNPYAGAKVVSLADMDAEFFAHHKTEYGA
jgi:hypothetical protein